MGVGGDGGSVTAAKIKGDIGNFTKTFGVDAEEMGGLIAGLAGGGSTPGITGAISNIVAGRIAAMFAADETTSPDALTTANAVSAISKVIAKAIGADLDGDAAFDFVDAGAAGFNLSDGDTVIDGLVIALTAGYEANTVTATPLQLTVV